MELLAFMQDENTGVSEMAVWVGQREVWEAGTEPGAHVGVGRTWQLLASASKVREDPPEKLVLGRDNFTLPFRVSSGWSENHIDMRQINSNKSNLILRLLEPHIQRGSKTEEVN